MIGQANDSFCHLIMIEEIIEDGMKSVKLKDEASQTMVEKQ